VDLNQLVTADQLAATASEQNDLLSNVTADFARLGIPINNRTKLTIEIVAGENSGTIIDGNLAVRNPPTDGFIVDDTYDPSTISGPVWLMYDRTTDSGDRGDVYQLESQFKVIDAEGYDGEPVSNVTFEEKTTERYSTDRYSRAEYSTRQTRGVPAGDQEDRDALIEEEATGGGWGRLLRRRCERRRDRRRSRRCRNRVRALRTGG